MSSLRWPDPNDHAEQQDTPERKRAELVRLIDRGFNWRVFMVASSGFFALSYSLFSLNVTFPMLAYVYEDEIRTQSAEVTFNIVTVAGSILGSLLFGHLADRYGRRPLYGIELIILIFTTVGVTETSAGFAYQTSARTSSSMSFSSWLSAWRFLRGIGIGAEFPLSACITAEWSAVQSRARMMSALFLMQPLGQLCAYLVELCALVGYGRHRENWGDNSTPLILNESKVLIDSVWRIVSGAGVVPALIALIFRFTIPESGRFTYDVSGKWKAQQALDDTRWVYDQPPTSMSRPKDPDLEGLPRCSESHLEGSSAQNEIPYNSASSNIALKKSDATIKNEDEVCPNSLPLTNPKSPMRSRISSPVINGSRTAEGEKVTEQARETHPSGQSYTKGNDHELNQWRQGDDGDASSTPGSDAPSWNQFSRSELKDFFIAKGKWRQLVGTSVCWCLLNFTFFGLGFNRADILAKIWADGPKETGHGVPVWRLESSLSDPGATIYDVLYNQAKQSLLTISIGSLLGSVAIVMAINRLDRRDLLVATFLVLAALLYTTGGVLLATILTVNHGVVIVFYALCQTFFSFGPNTLLFIIVAEIFPTRYRCTCYGVAAASGQLGSVFVELVFLSWHDGGYIEALNSSSFGRVLILFGAFLTVAAVFARAWIPRSQDIRDVPATPGGTNLRRKLRSKTLEELSEADQNSENGDGFGFRRLFRDIMERILSCCGER
ncbi:MAG: hypothetical protein M1822_001045 [Bathelium mastoideum]|nr:MAG: hypothetical protein M1822_001045 [Bathelium mastoideum]